MRVTPLLVLWLVLAGAACGGETAPMLHERQSFAGRVVVEVAGGGAVRRLDGDLTFDRATGNFQFAAVRDGVKRAISRLPSGDLRVFVDGVPAEVGPADRADIALLWELAGAGADATTARAGRGYAIRLGERRVSVEADEQEVVHGER